MIILDTNVLSERYRSNPDPAVKRWFETTPGAQAATTAITIAEMRYGAARLPQSRRRADLERNIERMIAEVFDGRVEQFDLAAATEYGKLAAAREKAGRPMGTEDAMIASICLSRKAVLATRNIKDFEDTGITLVNPWEL